MFDILIVGGLIVDGTGNTPYQGDVAIAGGRIVAVGRIEGAEATLVIDAGGLAVSPGFIDMHSHSDLSLVSHPRASSSLVQGITTEVAGSCGWSLAPLKNETAASVLKELCLGLMGAVPPELAEAPDAGPGQAAGQEQAGGFEVAATGQEQAGGFQVAATGQEQAGGLQGAAAGPAPARHPGLAWHSFGEYLTYLEKLGLGVNLYPIVGQSLIRAHVVGARRRMATPGEIEAQRALLEACLEEGARGLSTGRAYAPGGHASTEEVIALCRVVAARDGLYTSHIKDEGAGLIDAVAEAIRIGRESGVRVEISHHKAVGPANFGKVAETLTMMEEARNAGVDVTCDSYPYAFAQVFSMLEEIPGITPAQPVDEVRALLSQDDFRAKVTAEFVKASAEEHGPPGFFSRPESIMFISLGRDHDLEGQPLTSVFGPNPLGQAEPAPQPAVASGGAGASGAETSTGLSGGAGVTQGATGSTRPRPVPLEPARVRALVDKGLDFLLEQDLHVNLAAIMCEPDVETVLGHPQTMVGTDAFTIDRDLGERTPIHPRHFGTFPRVLGHYCRTRGLGDLATMIQKITGLPARKLRLAERGLLARGNWADVVVFDPATISDRATAKEPYLEPVGIKWVIVNGRVAAEDGKISDARAGMVLRR